MNQSLLLPALISRVPDVEMSISDALPTMLIPPAPSKVKAPAAVDHVDASAPVKVQAPAAVVKLEAVAASMDISAVESIVIAAAFISRVPDVEMSISDALPTMLIPPAPSKVKAPAAVESIVDCLSHHL